MRTHLDSPLHVLTVAGSLRRSSWNRKLLEAAAEEAPHRLTLAPFDELASVPLFDEDLEGDDPAAVVGFRRRVAAADGVLVATPEYNQSIPGVLKNALDWLSRPQGASCLAGKPVAVIGATPGSWGTRLAQKELRHALWASGALVLPDPPLYLRDVAALFDDAGRLVDGRTRESLAALLDSFAGFIRWTQSREQVAAADAPRSPRAGTTARLAPPRPEDRAPGTL